MVSQATRLTDWCKSSLNNRTQKCFLNGSLSDSQPLTCGIPQGTILRLLLFILYINDLPNCLVNSHPRIYADDTRLTAPHKISRVCLFLLRFASHFIFLHSKLVLYSYESLLIKFYLIKNIKGNGGN